MTLTFTLPKNLYNWSKFLLITASQTGYNLTKNVDQENFPSFNKLGGQNAKDQKERKKGHYVMSFWKEKGFLVKIWNTFNSQCFT